MSWFRDGGPAMYLILLVDALGLGLLPLLFALAVTARFSPPVAWPARVLSGLGLVGAALPAVVGALGWLHGRSLTEQAVAHAPEEIQETLRAAGYAMSLIPLQFGLGSWVVLGFLALIPFAVAVMPARGGAED